VSRENGVRKDVFLLISSVSALLVISLLILEPYTSLVKADYNFTDDFNTTTLDSSWTFIDPDGGSALSLTENPGWLRITTTSPPGRDLLGSVQNAPHILQSGFSGDFTIETKIMANTSENKEGGGIIVWQNSNAYVRYERLFTTDQMLFLYSGGSSGMGSATTTYPIPNINPTYLKLVRSGQQFSGYYSSDGTNWIHIGYVGSQASDPLSIGLDVINNNRNGNFFADFDYFKINSASPPLSPTPSPSVPVPEFPSFIVVPLLMAALIVGVIVYKKKLFTLQK
jgi:beta-xylosidase